MLGPMGVNVYNCCSPMDGLGLSVWSVCHVCHSGTPFFGYISSIYPFFQMVIACREVSLSHFIHTHYHIYRPTHEKIHPNATLDPPTLGPDRNPLS